MRTRPRIAIQHPAPNYSLLVTAETEARVLAEQTISVAEQAQAATTVTLEKAVEQVRAIAQQAIAAASATLVEAGAVAEHAEVASSASLDKFVARVASPPSTHARPIVTLIAVALAFIVVGLAIYLFLKRGVEKGNLDDCSTQETASAEQKQTSDKHSVSEPALGTQSANSSSTLCLQPHAVQARSAFEKNDSAADFQCIFSDDESPSNKSSPRGDEDEVPEKRRAQSAGPPMSKTKSLGDHTRGAGGELLKQLTRQYTKTNWRSRLLTFSRKPDGDLLDEEDDIQDASRQDVSRESEGENQQTSDDKQTSASSSAKKLSGQGKSVSFSRARSEPASKYEGSQP